jgi:V8-like Glu-specific endopeptidase
VALFSAGALTPSPDGATTRLRLNSYGEGSNLCPDERFYDEKAGAFCSGSLVAPDLIMTAGHCIQNERACQATRIVFDFGIHRRNETTPELVPTTSVYSCKSIIGRRLDPLRGVDYAIVRIDRAVTDRSPLPLARRSSLTRGTSVVVIGHPAGLATKVAGGATVRGLKRGYFVANLDTYGGNSGSAVLNAQTGEVEGILVRGETDFVRQQRATGTCNASNRCASGACRGEDVTSIEKVLRFVPESL